MGEDLSDADFSDSSTVGYPQLKKPIIPLNFSSSVSSPSEENGEPM